MLGVIQGVYVMRTACQRGAWVDWRWEAGDLCRVGLLAVLELVREG